LEQHQRSPAATDWGWALYPCANAPDVAPASRGCDDVLRAVLFAHDVLESAGADDALDAPAVRVPPAGDLSHWSEL
jgi:hypothetical protein